MAIPKIESDSDGLKSATTLEINSMSMYLYEINDKLESLEEEFIEQLDDEVETIKDEREKQYYRNWLEWHYKEVFPRIFFNSFHIASYSLLESWLRVWADRIGDKQQQMFKVSEIRGADYLESARIYLRKLTGIDIGSFSSWSGLRHGQRLRNIIVHSNGSVYKESEISLARQHNVYNAPNKEIVMTYDYCKSFLNTLRAFFIELYNQVKAGDFL